MLLALIKICGKKRQLLSILQGLTLQVRPVVHADNSTVVSSLIVIDDNYTITGKLHIKL